MKKKFVLAAVVIICAAAALFAFCGGNSGYREAKLFDYAPNNEITGSYDKALSAKCENGVFVGKKTGDVIEFRGIPYAQQPVGSLRWKAPQEPLPSDKVFEAYHDGKSCLQVPDPYERASLYEQGEDCLSLNVFVNSKDKNSKKPVMVFIHGGGYEQGGHSDPLYDGFNFVRENPDVILVVTTYRFGLMGIVDFSQVPGGENYMDACNLPLLDQIATLKWVKKNIAAFGGDPDCVTIFGESAGGGSVSNIVVSPLSKGLFKRAIPMSGACTYGQKRADSQVLTKTLMKRFGAKNMDDLIKISYEDLSKFWVDEGGMQTYNFPIIDERMLPSDTLGAWNGAAIKDIEIMQGITKDEWRYFIEVFADDIDFFNLVNDVTYKMLAENASPEYLETSAKLMDLLTKTYGKEWALTEFGNGQFFRAGQMYQAIAHAKQGGKEFFYRVDKEIEGPKQETLKACHAVELPFVFGNFDNEQAKNTKENRAYAKQLQRMWINFAKTGNPSLSAQDNPDGKAVEWQPFTDDTRKVMILAQGNLHMEDNPEAERTELEQKLLDTNPHYRHIRGLAPVLARIAQIPGKADAFKKIMEKNVENAQKAKAASK